MAENKPKLSDVARQTNTEKAARFSSTMIPRPPLPKSSEPPVAEPAPSAPTETVVGTPVTDSLTETIQPGEADFAEGRGTILTVDDLKAEVSKPDTSPVPVEKAATPTKARGRRSGHLTIDDVVNGDSPKGEPYPRQVRVSEKHHKLLRKLAFTHDVTINHVLYNLLDQLDQADQRDQQKD